MSTVSQCTGACCACFAVRAGFFERSTELPDGFFMLDMLVSLSPDEATKRMEDLGITWETTAQEAEAPVDFSAWEPDGNGRVLLFTCRHWDTETRLCRAYDERPAMCRDYPYPGGGPCRWCGATIEGDA